MQKTNKKRVLVVAAHADDEVLGCGGTIARHASMGDQVDILILADGVTSRKSIEQSQADRASDCMRAAKILGANKPILVGLPDNKMDSLPLLDVVQKVEPVIFDLNPDIVYTHHGNDLNIDHVITHRTVMTALRGLPESFVQSIYSFEILSSTEWSSPDTGRPFTPNHYVEIEGFMPKKIEAMKVYDAEMRPYPHPRSLKTIESLATLRGSQSGLLAAEAFHTLRSFWR